MSFIKKLSIRRKQMFIMMLTSCVVVVLCGGSFVAFDVLKFREELVENASTTASVMGNIWGASPGADSSGAATEVLGALRAEPNIDAAAFYDGHGALVTSYTRTGANVPVPSAPLKFSGEEFTSKELRMYRPVVSGNKTGVIFLAYNLGELSERLARYGWISVAVLLMSLMVAFVLSIRLQRLVSQPVLNLAKVARKVAEEKNYSMRAEKSGADEVGQLVDGFNEMLAQIQARDGELQAARETLERRVNERTAQMSESVAMLNATLESTADGIFAVDLAGRVTAFNRRFAEIWQIPVELLECANYEDIKSYLSAGVVDQEQTFRLIEGMRKAPESSLFDVVELQDGRVFERHALPQRINNQCVGVVVNWRDITEHDRAENALRQSQALYHSLVNQMPAGIYRKDAEGRYVFVNDWFCAFSRRKSEHYLGKTVAEVSADLQGGRLDAVVVKQLTEFARDHHLHIMQTGKRIEVEEKHTFSDGSVRYLQVVKTPVFDSAGEVVGSQGIQFDITPQKLVQLELSYERDLFKALMDNFPDSIYFKDLDSRFVRVSRSKAEKTYGGALESHRVQHPDEKLPAHLADAEAFSSFIIGKTDFDFLPLEFADERFVEEQKIIQTGKPLLMKMDEAVLSSGKMAWYLTSKIPWRDRDGKIIGTFGTTKDVTVIKEAEARLEQVHKDLLTASRQAGMAEVASNVLHNVGNVLNSVNVSATLAADIARKSKVSSLAKVLALMDQHAGDLGRFLQEDPKGQQIPGYLRRLHDHLVQEQQTSITELESLRKHIEHIRDIVTMQQNYAKMSGLTEVVNVSELVEDSLRMNAGALQRHDVQVVREYENVPVINVEKHKVLQILVNLIRNAKYACDEGGTKEKRMTVRIANGEGRIKIVVADNGIGIPEENLNRIFNHGFTTRKTGHGFGLHSGALAAKEMGGKLTVQSQGVGHGATFILDLPLVAGGKQ